MSSNSAIVVEALLAYLLAYWSLTTGHSQINKLIISTWIISLNPKIMNSIKLSDTFFFTTKRLQTASEFLYLIFY